MVKNNLYFILFFLFIYETTSVDKQPFNECRRCKLLVDSFDHWLDKTSRGKHEGGDADWEEKKLKSYARSEMRLVEIQEGLCSELKKHKDYCYSLAEEAEHPLEKWWFSEHSNTNSLYTWLCIETLQHCCPSKHFGPHCSPCMLLKNDVCGGNGKCSGDGTRNGNGSCLCSKGYSGKLCEECDKHFYRNNLNMCLPCDKSCKLCYGSGPSECRECHKGWINQMNTCIDVNECSDPSICKSNQLCLNHDGGYTCKNCHKSCETCIGLGSKNCTSCNNNSSLWGRICVDEIQRSEFLNSGFKRILLYCGLLTILLFIFRYSKSLASIVVLIVAMYIYISESNSEMNIYNVCINTLL